MDRKGLELRRMVDKDAYPRCKVDSLVLDRLGDVQVQDAARAAERLHIG
eukprot:CAMPEP_0181228440 /NCGR_PEP_ID=MMETSP1096-20121128/33348_1 /TAXON_ID=156174 ORGANISM="Chrysochromulina ericina, Strain CCMP281" /NCGR_SAMPLE_ID=MMETSP1096 /ASSEMBLY_ACC=CAM_ASM_000453 /LENGTH=48 /DNA_ID= /DNA_START= /DNA_END= /DNA_ORIENTATION=